MFEALTSQNDITSYKTWNIHNNLCLELTCNFMSRTKQLVGISLAITFAGTMIGVYINYMVQDSAQESHTLMAKTV
jgi:hypothetical protein